MAVGPPSIHTQQQEADARPALTWQEEEFALGIAREESRKRQREYREEVKRVSKKLKRTNNPWLFSSVNTSPEKPLKKL